MGKVKNFATFYGLLKSIQPPDKELFKRDMVRQFTKGRTESLREMDSKEYEALCASLAEHAVDTDHNKQIKAARSAVLRRLGRMGIDTDSWEEIDLFLLNPRIAGKRFKHLSIAELKGLHPKLIAIEKKPHKSRHQANPSLSDDDILYMIQCSPCNQLPS